MSDREPLSTEPYKGVRDFYPGDWGRMQAIFSTVRTALRLYGYEEYNASPLERAELYESKTSEEIVNEQTYTFTDRGDRRVTLRPEMTPSLARMVAAKRRELPFPVRWFSIGNRFRYERPQKGRLREFYQIDIDLIGFPDGAGELEAVKMASTVLKSLGAQETDFVIRMNSRELLNAAGLAIGLNDEDMNAYLGVLDRKNKMTPEKFEEMRAAFRRPLRSAPDGTSRDPLEVIESGLDTDVQGIYSGFLAFIDALKSKGIMNVVFDATIVRGFLYYTGLVFEIYDTNPENPRALMGGGRYDGLIGMFGGDQVPAVGFAMGDVTLLDFLTTHSIAPEYSAAPDVYIGTPSDSDKPSAEAYAESLRTQGVRCILHVNGKEKGLGDQIRDAARRGIPYFIAYGEEEASSGDVKLKTLESGEEEHMRGDAVAAHVLERGANF